tara:strand:- start:12089 stop:12490 length:402 start_codon:yes stop_codon:yes gene_type:complete
MEVFKVPGGFTASRELNMAGELLIAIADNRYDPSDPAKDYFENRGPIEIGFNPNSGFVFASDEDYNTVLLGDNGLYLFITTSWSGQEGDLEEHIENMLEYDDYETDDVEYIVEDFGKYISAENLKRIKAKYNQ